VYPLALRQPRIGAIPAVGLLFLAAMAASLTEDHPATNGKSEGSTAKPPLVFVPNRGQTDAHVRFYAQSGNFSAFFTRRAVVLDFRRGSKGSALRLRFAGANPRSPVVATRRAPGTVNYFSGRSRYTNLPAYAEVRYKELWPGIDLAFRSDQGRLKYELLVRPGADPSRIRLAYAGADSLTLDKTGALVIGTSLGPLGDSKPVTHQGDTTIASSYALNGHAFGFGLGAYDHSRPLVIDPGVVYSTLLGGSDGSGAPGDDPKAIAVDSAGSAYVVGDTSSPDFPTTTGAYQENFNAQSPFTVFVSKLNASGTGLVYSTYLGGSAGDEAGGVAVDGSGNAYIVGDTGSPDFPTTPGTDRTLDGLEAFVTKLDPSGSSLVYSTFLGGSDIEHGTGIAIDQGGNA
jgi:hypothetical protein